MAEAGQPFDWTTPTGSRCRQAYFEQPEVRIPTLMGRLQIPEEHKEGTLNAGKQANGSAPNVVHSFDAAHLALTVLKAKEEGVTSFSMVHDSYGTHAGNTTRLSRILREVFVDIYSTNWLTALAADLDELAPRGDLLPPPPARGDFDIRAVLDAPYFFS